MVAAVTRLVVAAPLALGLAACSRFDVDDPRTGPAQSPQQYGAAAGNQPVAAIST
jgi:hypothetical protein